MTKTIDDRYRLEERIGAGGMGEVWRGTDLRLQRPVAVKMLHESLREDADQAARFQAEARTIAQIHHANVVRVYDFGQEGASAYIVMEFIEGRSLGDILREEGRLTVERTAAIMAQAAEALHAVHKRGVIHRDVKPDNLIVQEDGTVVLTDFGIARHDMSMTLTATGTVIGTAYYMSPEQVSGERPVPASDQYSLGIVTYRCLVGELPFDGDTPISVAVKQLKDPVPDLPKGLPSAMTSAVLKSLRKKPADRWPDCAAYARALMGMIPKGETTASLAVAKTTLMAKTRQLMPKSKGSAAVTKPATSLPVTEAAPVAPKQRVKASAQAPKKPVAPPAATKVAPKVPVVPPAAPPAAPVKPAAPRKKGGMSTAVMAVLAGIAALALVLYLVTREGDTPNAGNNGGNPNQAQGENNGGDPNAGGGDNGETDEPDTGDDSPNTGNNGNDNGGDNGSSGNPNSGETYPLLPMNHWNIPDVRTYLGNHGVTPTFQADESAPNKQGGCLVSKQSPEAGTTVKNGDPVTVWVHPECLPAG